VVRAGSSHDAESLPDWQSAKQAALDQLMFNLKAESTASR
jgi:hypothetical protein